MSAPRKKYDAAILFKTVAKFVAGELFFNSGGGITGWQAFAGVFNRVGLWGAYPGFFLKIVVNLPESNFTARKGLGCAVDKGFVSVTVEQVKVDFCASRPTKQVS